MNTPERDKDQQVQISKWRGIKTAAVWLAPITGVFLIAQIVMMARGREQISDLAPTVSGLIIWCCILFLAQKKIKGLVGRHST